MPIEASSRQIDHPTGTGSQPGSDPDVGRPIDDVPNVPDVPADPLWDDPLAPKVDGHPRPLPEPLEPVRDRDIPREPDA